MGPDCATDQLAEPLADKIPDVQAHTESDERSLPHPIKTADSDPVGRAHSPPNTFPDARTKCLSHSDSVAQAHGSAYANAHSIPHARAHPAAN